MFPSRRKRKKKHSFLSTLISPILRSPGTEKRSKHELGTFFLRVEVGNRAAALGSEIFLLVRPCP